MMVYQILSALCIPIFLADSQITSQFLKLFRINAVQYFHICNLFPVTLFGMLTLPFSYLHIAAFLTPSIRPSSSWVMPREFRSCFSLFIVGSP